MIRAVLLTAAAALPFLGSPTLAQSGQGAQDTLESQQRPSLLRPDSLIGREVLSEDGDKVGTVEDVVMAANSDQPEQLIIAGGGYPGMDGKRVAVDYGFRDLDVRGDWVVTKDVAAQEIASLESVQGGNEAVSLGSSDDEAPDPMKLRNRY